MASRNLTATLLALGALALAPSAAVAADTYVDGDTGSDSNDCTASGTPCETIGQGLIQAGSNDTVHVDDASPNYLESQVLDDGKSLVAQDLNNSITGAFTIFGTSGPTIAVGLGDTGGTVS